MAIDSRIALGLQPLNVGQRFAQNVQNLQQVDLLNQRREQAPLQNKLLELGVNEQQRQADILGTAQSQALLSQEQANKLDVANATQLNPFLQANDVQGVLSTLNQQRARAQELGMLEDVAEFDQAIQLAQTPQGLETLKQVTSNFLTPTGSQVKSVGQKERQDALRILETDPEMKTNAGKEAAIFLGLEPKAAISKEERIAESERKRKLINQQAADKAAAIEEAKLEKQLKLAPEISAAVDTAKSAVKAIASDAKLAKSNQKALAIYEVGIRNLADSLGKTSTGPIVSLFTGLTDSARTADGAKAIMLPVLKQMFRESGEGTFTDKDQEVLENMIPTRRDSPETAKAKLEMIDAIVQAKLGATQESVNKLGGEPNVSSGFKILSVE